MIAKNAIVVVCALLQFLQDSSGREISKYIHFVWLLLFIHVFGWHMSCFGATGTPVLDFWWRLLWVSFFAEANVMYNPWDPPGAKQAHLLAVGMQPVTSPHAYTEVGLDSDSNRQSPIQKTNVQQLCQRPGFCLAPLNCNPQHALEIFHVCKTLKIISV